MATARLPIARPASSPRRRLRSLAVVLALVAPSVTALAAQPAEAAPQATLVRSGSVRLSSLVPSTGRDGVSEPEFSLGKKGAEEDGGDPGTQARGPRAPGARVAPRGPEVALTFAGLNHRDNRLANGGNQFSSEPPDQALCVGPDHVLEGVNTVLQVFDKAGHASSPVLSLNEFFGYPAAINRTTGVFGAFITDPVCHFDARSGRFYFVALTLDQDPATGNFTGRNRLDLAVSATSDPTGLWQRYKLPVQNDGTEGTPDHNCDPGPAPAPPGTTNPSACIGDYPHIGADRYGIYLTTNEYSFFGDGTHGGLAYTGAQIYAISKAQLARGVATPTITTFSSPTLGPFRSFTVWPAISPAGQEARRDGGTEFLLSSTLGDGSETGNTAASERRIGLWSITNTRSLDSATPALRLQNRLIDADRYALPPKATQKPGPTPLRDCLNDRSNLFGAGLGCWALFFDQAPAQHEVLSPLDANDTRMQQVVYSQGMVYGALDTAVSVGRGKDAQTRAGILWVGVRPDTEHGRLRGRTTRSGYVAVAHHDVTYPAVGLTSTGKLVMAATLTGRDHYPSASYTVLNNGRRPTVRVVSEGLGPQDGFTGYSAFVGDPPRPRWGDYGAAAMSGSTLWLASESIEQRCTLAEYLGDGSAVGSCGGTRTALANWGTRVTALRW